MKRFLKIVLIIIGLVAMGAGAFLGARDLREISKFQGAIDERELSWVELRTQLIDWNARLKGNQQSIAALPDSTKLQKSGLFMKSLGKQNKAIRNLTLEIRETKRLIRRDQRRRAAVKSHLAKWSGSLAGGGTVLLVGAFFLRRRTPAG